MGVRWPGNANKDLQTNSVDATVATTVLITEPLNTSIDNARVLLLWYVALSLGADLTNVVVNLYRGTDTTGTQLTRTSQADVGAGPAVVMSGVYIDDVGIAADTRWNIGVTTQGGADASTVTDGCIAVIGL